jgi:preprotein translocase subunit SecF
MFELFKGLKVDWLGKRKLFFVISSVLLLAGMASLVIKGRFVYGTDFRGGTVVVVKFDEAVDIGAVRNLLPEAEIQSMQSTGAASAFQIQLAKAVENEDATVGRETVTKALSTAFAGKFKIESSESVSAKVGEELRRKAVTATLYALAGILIYIAFRFEWIYGAAAVFAVFHDALVTLGFFSLFNYEINLTVIAALLTLVGYSVNDTSSFSTGSGRI